jgi:branched-chain amino acid transport system ATP-binding protein
MVAIGRALMTNPRLLMLDEPSLGLAPLLVRSIFEVLVEINRGGVAVFLVEQNVHAALTLAHRAYILEAGCVVEEGNAAQLLQSPHVRRAYLGPLAAREYFVP